MKIYDKKLAYPYFVWMVLFTVVPLFIVVYYALTDASGSFTLDNLVAISGYGSVFARSLLLALIATVVCLVLAFPVGYFLSRLRVNKQHMMLRLQLRQQKMATLRLHGMQQQMIQRLADTVYM